MVTIGDWKWKTQALQSELRWCEETIEKIQWRIEILLCSEDAKDCKKLSIPIRLKFSELHKKF